MSKLKAFQLTNREFVEIYKGLTAVKDIKNSRFAVIVARNIKELTTKLAYIESMAIPSDEFRTLSYQASKFIEENNSEELERLEQENEALINDRKQQLIDIEEELDAEATIYLEEIREDQLPEDLTPDQIFPLLKIIKNDSE